MGEWMKKYGESIYGTRGGPIPPRPWGVTTYKDNKVFVHVLDWKDKTLAIPEFGKKIKSAEMLVNGTSVKFKQGKSDILLYLPDGYDEEIDRIIVLEY